MPRARINLGVWLKHFSALKRFAGWAIQSKCWCGGIQALFIYFMLLRLLADRRAPPHHHPKCAVFARSLEAHLWRVNLHAVASRSNNAACKRYSLWPFQLIWHWYQREKLSNIEQPPQHKQQKKEKCSKTEWVGSTQIHLLGLIEVKDKKETQKRNVDDRNNGVLFSGWESRKVNEGLFCLFKLSLPFPAFYSFFRLLVWMPAALLFT